jgi:CubicO group peptidase (beta-lactamase class C family)
MGGGGLYGTARDYLAFTRMLMHDGRLGSAQVLRPETVRLMCDNHIGALELGPIKTAMPALSNDIDLLPGITKKWGISFMINAARTPTGRSAGSVAWAGLANTYFWIDRARKVSGVFLSQVFPFFDGKATEMFGTFETEVYRAAGSAIAA